MTFGVHNIVMAAQKCGIVLGVKIGVKETARGESPLYAKFRLPFDDVYTLRSAVGKLAELDPDTPINVSIPKIEQGDLFIQLKPVMSARRVHVLMVAMSKGDLDSPLTEEELNPHLEALGLKDMVAA